MTLKTTESRAFASQMPSIPVLRDETKPGEHTAVKTFLKENFTQRSASEEKLHHIRESIQKWDRERLERGYIWQCWTLERENKKLHQEPYELDLKQYALREASKAEEIKSWGREKLESVYTVQTLQIEDLRRNNLAIQLLSKSTGEKTYGSQKENAFADRVDWLRSEIQAEKANLAKTVEGILEQRRELKRELGKNVEEGPTVTEENVLSIIAKEELGFRKSVQPLTDSILRKQAEAKCLMEVFPRLDPDHNTTNIFMDVPEIVKDVQDTCQRLKDFYGVDIEFKAGDAAEYATNAFFTAEKTPFEKQVVEYLKHEPNEIPSLQNVVRFCSKSHHREGLKMLMASMEESESLAKAYDMPVKDKEVEEGIAFGY